MASRISVDELAVRDVLKKCILLVEDAGMALNGVKKALSSAEIQGWNDESYSAFAEDYSQSEKKIKDALKDIEELSVPKLKGILRSISEF